MTQEILDAHHLYDDGHECSVCSQRMQEQEVREVAYYDGWKDGWEEGSAAAYSWVLDCCRLILETKTDIEVQRITGLIRDQMELLGLKPEDGVLTFSA